MSDQNSNNIPVLKDINIVKIAVELENEVPQLIEFDQKRPLSAVIQDLCSVWTLKDPFHHSLQFSDSTQIYITEQNRHEIKNGSVLRLTSSPQKTVQEVLEKMNNGTTQQKKETLEMLMKLATDFTFSVEFISQHGLDLLITMIEENSSIEFGLAYTLNAFVELMDHGIVSWDIIKPKFITMIAFHVNNHKSGMDPAIIQASLVILESLVQNNPENYPLLEQEVTLTNLVHHLQCSNPEIQLNTLALINAFFLKVESSKRTKVGEILSSKRVRNIILNNIIQGPGKIGSEMAHQLYVLQTMLFNMLEERRSNKIDSQDQVEFEKILEIKKIAFDSENEISNPLHRKPGSFAKEYKKLGFKNHLNPSEDFSKTPLGMLALDNMVYFARNHTESYTKVVLQNSCRADGHECPFGSTSIELTKLLCDILRIGDLPTEQGEIVYPMFFTHDHPFEEFYVICIQLLNKTWNEMRATVEDFNKVLGVVREQITRALDSSATTLDTFKAKLAVLTYSEISHLWREERSSREEWESQAIPIVELREQITPEIMGLIKQQRLAYLVDGTMFNKYSSKGSRIKDKFWFCRLSPNHKIFYYGDCEEKAVPSLEDLTNTLPVVEIKTMVTGKECPHMKECKSKKSTFSVSFSLMLDVEPESLNFVAPNETVFEIWTDGINALIGKNMKSKLTKTDLETLLSMDIKLRLLDTEGVTIPEKPPPIPKLPSNYDFYYYQQK